MPPRTSVALVVTDSIDCVKIIMVVDVNMDRIDADNGTVLLVKVSNLPEILESVRP
jgi:hypothetical protein